MEEALLGKGLVTHNKCRREKRQILKQAATAEMHTTKDWQVTAEEQIQHQGVELRHPEPSSPVFHLSVGAVRKCPGVNLDTAGLTSPVALRGQKEAGPYSLSLLFSC